MPRGSSQYTIPDQNADRTSVRLYEQYRARLDADRSRQQREKIIDVRASSVAIEQNASTASGRRAAQAARNTSQGRAATSATAESSNAPARQTRRAGADETATSGAYAYEPRTKAAGVELKPSPQARGVFVDLMA